MGRSASGGAVAATSEQSHTRTLGVQKPPCLRTAAACGRASATQRLRAVGADNTAPAHASRAWASACPNAPPCKLRQHHGPRESRTVRLPSSPPIGVGGPTKFGDPELRDDHLRSFQAAVFAKSTIPSRDSLRSTLTRITAAWGLCDPPPLTIDQCR